MDPLGTVIAVTVGAGELVDMKVLPFVPDGTDEGVGEEIAGLVTGAVVKLTLEDVLEPVEGDCTVAAALADDWILLGVSLADA